MEVKNVVPKTRNKKENNKTCCVKIYVVTKPIDKKENNKTCCVKIVFVTLWIVCAVAVCWMCYLVSMYGRKQ